MNPLNGAAEIVNVNPAWVNEPLLGRVPETLVNFNQPVAPVVVGAAVSEV